MPMWVAAVLAYPPAMGIASFMAFRSSRRAVQPVWRPSLFRASIGEQAERWLQAQSEL